LERNESMKQEVTRRSSTSSSPPLTKKDSQMEEDNLIPKVSTGQSSKSVPNGEKVKSSSSDEEEEKEDLPEIPFSRILALNKPEWHYMLGRKGVLSTRQIWFKFHGNQTVRSFVSCLLLCLIYTVVFLPGMFMLKFLFFINVGKFFRSF